MKSQPLFKLIIFGIFGVIFLSFLSNHSAKAQLELNSLNLGKSKVSASTINKLKNQISDIWVVRVYFNSRQEKAKISAWAEPWEVNNQKGYLIVGVTQVGFNQLQAEGYQIEIDHEKTALVNRSVDILPMQISGIPGYPCYRTVEETFSTAENIVADHPTLAEWIDIGDSWDKINAVENSGYDLMVLRLTNETNLKEKPKLFIMTAIHAREYATAELATRFAEYLAKNYDLDPDINWLLDNTEIHLLLQSNPDGRKKAETGLYWRKNSNQNYCSPTSNYRGADLNRNFDFQWGCCNGSSSSECEETYRGPSSASEPEVQAIQKYLRSIFPDQRGEDLSDPAAEKATGVFLDIHAYGQIVIWPWGFTYSSAPNGTALQTLGRKFAFFNNYEPAQAVELYPTDGTTDDFAYGDLGLAAFTFELGTSFFQDCSTFENVILPKNLPALIYAAKATRTPYLTPAGPDAIDISFSPNIVSPGELVTLSATTNDTRFNNSNGTEPAQNIIAAEYYIDIPPWATGAISHTLSALDGSFDSPIENVTANIDTTGFSIGRHLIFIRGLDSDGNWGAISSIFLTLIEYQFLPIVQ